MKINPMKALIECKKKLEEEKARLEELKKHPCYNCIFFNYDDKSCFCTQEVNREKTPCYISISSVINYLNTNNDILNNLKNIED